MRRAHEAWRGTLEAVSIAEVVATLPDTVPAKNRRLLLGP
jgi:hypothetical protein